MTSRACAVCRVVKREAEDFYHAASRQCKSCTIARVRGRILRNESNFLANLYAQCKMRHKRAGHAPETLLPRDVFVALYAAQEGRCAETGDVFDIRRSRMAPSPDRIDNAQGYTRGNVRFVTWTVNRCRGDMSIPEFRALCARVRRA